MTGRPVNRWMVRGMVMDIMTCNYATTAFGPESFADHGETEDSIAETIEWYHSHLENPQPGDEFSSVAEPIFRAYLRSVLEDLQEMGFVKEVETGQWLRQDHPTLLTYDELRQMREDQAEVKAGNGSQSVYGWYLVAYRQLADMKGEEVFPMKIGTTIFGSFGRAKTHIGTAPQKPVLGFLLRVDQAAKIEGDLHKYLKEKGRHMPEALGKEWFLTNPNELYSLTRDMLMESVAEKKRDLAWSERTLEELGNAP